MPDLGIAEAIRQAQGWCPLCGGSGMVMEFEPTDCANLDVHRELGGLLSYMESLTFDRPAPPAPSITKRIRTGTDT